MDGKRVQDTPEFLQLGEMDDRTRDFESDVEANLQSQQGVVHPGLKSKRHSTVISQLSTEGGPPCGNSKNTQKTYV
jgi:hypothetical protein